jgi:protein-tyrosine phosphatase
MPTIVFVCRANRFRSPYAAACFRRELGERKMDADWRVISAGTQGTGRLPPLRLALQHADRKGMDLSEHASRGVHAAQVQAADLIIVMEQQQKEDLQRQFPEEALKVYLLSEAAVGAKFDIPDLGPWVLPENITTMIEGLIHVGFDRICALLAQK